MNKNQRINREIAEIQLEDAFDFNGRYQPECDKRVYEILADGGTLAIAATEFKVSLRTVERWKQPKLQTGEINPSFRQSFAEACLLGRAANLAWFDKTGRNVLENPKKDFNAAIYIYERKRRFSESEQRMVPLAHVSNANSYQDKAKALFEEAAAGNISADELQKYTASLANVAKLIEFEALINDVKELKKLNGLTKKGESNDQEVDEE